MDNRASNPGHHGLRAVELGNSFLSLLARGQAGNRRQGKGNVVAHLGQKTHFVRVKKMGLRRIHL